MNLSYVRNPQMRRGLEGSFDIIEAGIRQTGNIYYVDRNGSDSAAGDSPDNPLATLNAAIGKCTDWNGDLIIVNRGTYTVTETVAFDVKGITVVANNLGMNQPGEMHTIWAHADLDDAPVGIITQPCHLIGLGFAGKDTTKESLKIEGTTGFTGGYNLIEQCRFGTWGGAMDAGLRIAAGNNNRIINCTFDGTTVGFGTAAIVLEGSGAHGPSSSEIIGNLFKSVGATKHAIKFGGWVQGIVIIDNIMSAGQTGGGTVADATGKMLDNDSKYSSGIVATNYTAAANKGAAFENLTNTELAFSDNHYNEA